MIHTVEIEDVEDIVRMELQWHYDSMYSDNDPEADELLNALEIVIKYFSVGDEYES